MSPVRGKGWYKRPYHLTWIDHEGHKKHAEYHTRVSAENWERTYREIYHFRDVVLVSPDE